MDNWSDTKKECYFDFIEQMLKDGYIRKPRKKAAVDKKIPFAGIVDLYNITFAQETGNSEVLKLTSKRRSLVTSAWNFDTDNKNPKLLTNDLSYWKRYFEFCAGVEFFQASTKRSAGHENWKPDFEFIIKPDTQLKCREGQYT